MSIISVTLRRSFDRLRMTWVTRVTFYEAITLDDCVKSEFPPPLAGGDQGEGE